MGENTEIDDNKKIDNKIYIINDTWTLDCKGKTIYRNEEIVNLTNKMFKFVEILTINNRRVCTFEALCNYSFGIGEGYYKSITQLLHDMKEKDEDLWSLIKSVRNEGYRLEANVKLVKRPDENLQDIGEFTFDNKLDFIDLSLIGRDKEIEAIDNSLSKGKVLFISGIDGVGKTSVVKQYAYYKISEYNNIFYLQCTRSIVSLIADDMLIPNMGLSKLKLNDGSLEDDDNYYLRKLSKMKEMVSDKTLFILDDYQGELQELESLFSLNAKFIVVTHRNLDGIGYASLTIDSLDEENRRALFFKHYSRWNDIEETDTYLQKLFELVWGHTLSIILMAKQLMVSRMYPEELYMKIDKEGLRNALTEDVRMNAMSTSRSAFTYIRELFKTSELSQEEFKILKLICVFSPAKIKSRDLRKWTCEKRIFNIIDSLHAAGWIEIDNVADMVYVLPIIKEVVLAHEAVCITGEEMFFQEFLKEYSDFDLFSLSLAEKHYYCEIARNILKYELPLNDDLFLFFTKAQRLLSEFYVDESINAVSNALKQLSEKSENFYKIGYLHYCKAWTKSTKLNCRAESLEDYKKSIDYMEKSAQIENDKEVSTNIYADYGINLCRTGYGDEAIQYIQNAIDILNEGPNENKKLMRICWYKAFLVECYLVAQNYDAAKKQLDEAYSIHAQCSSEEDAYLSNLLYRDSMIAYAKEDYSEAKKLALKGFEIYSKYYPEKSISNVKHLCYIGCILLMNKETNKSKRYFEKARMIAKETYENPDEIIVKIKKDYGINE